MKETLEKFYLFIEDNKWHQVALTNDEFFIDGELKGTLPQDVSENEPKLKDES